MEVLIAKHETMLAPRIFRDGGRSLRLSRRLPSFNRLLKNVGGWDDFRFPFAGGVAGLFGKLAILQPLAQAASSLGNRARLLATIVRVNRARTRSRPRRTVWAMPPTVLAQPKGSSIFLRRFWERA